MRATELKSKLQDDLAGKEAALEALHAQRLKLVLPANAGDAEAALRLQDLRSDAERLKGDIKDLEQALVDVERLVAIEQAEAQYVERQRLLANFEAACTGAGAQLAALDAAVAGLAEAYRAAAEATNAIQGLAVELLVPLVDGSNVTMVMQRRYEALATVRLGDLRERFDAVLRREMMGQPQQKLADWFAETLRHTGGRLREVMESDRRRAVAAGAAVEPEAA